MKLEVFDKDTGLNPDDLLGFVQIDWLKCIESPGIYD